jgi:hypothetical protein
MALTKSKLKENARMPELRWRTLATSSKLKTVCSKTKTLLSPSLKRRLERRKRKLNKLERAKLSIGTTMRKSFNRNMMRQRSRGPNQMNISNKSSLWNMNLTKLSKICKTLKINCLR